MGNSDRGVLGPSYGCRLVNGFWQLSETPVPPHFRIRAKHDFSISSVFHSPDLPNARMCTTISLEGMLQIRPRDNNDILATGEGWGRG